MAKPVLKIEYLPLTTMLRAPRNPKHHHLDGIEASIQEHGFTQPLVLDERTGRIVEGHGRLDALLRMKQTGAPLPLRVVEQKGDWYVPVVRGVSFETDEQAEKYLLGANQLVVAGGWDDRHLTAMLRDLAAAGENLASTGFDQATLDALVTDFQQAQTAPPTVPEPPAPVPVPTAPPAPAPTAPPAPAPVTSTGTPAPAPIADTEQDLPAIPSPTPATCSAEEAGILDPLNRELSKGVVDASLPVLRFMRYTIPLTTEESAWLEQETEAWVQMSGALYGFVQHLRSRTETPCST